ncbi:MAG: response regulator [Deltaproteobacteria bacterium]|nr:response regulator [Deltaproteobacteria bacterium]MBF0524633.1 response regulator [Deltaproteobacteria bacterium]
MIDRTARILVVDDARNVRFTVTLFLRKLGYSNIQDAPEGVTAFKLLKAKKFDFIICDWNMPVMNGLELLRKVRDDETLRHIPFLMITAEALKENIVQAIQEGVTQYIVKPFSQKTLQEKMKAIFG